MSKDTALRKPLFVLDTNVLMHDPTAIFRFEEHDIFLPMVVLEELDKNKRGISEVSRSVRQVSRFMDELLYGASKEEIDAGLSLPGPTNGGAENAPERGRLFFQTQQLPDLLPDNLPGNIPDNNILGTALALQQSIRSGPSSWCRKISTCASRPPPSVSAWKTTPTTG
jgi:PhoH-like ATPase